MYITLINTYGREWIIKSFSREQVCDLKNKNTNVLELLDTAFESLTFNDYIEFLFSEYTILTTEAAIEEALLKIENNNSDILTIKNILSSSKKKTSLWNKIFEKKFDIFNKQILEDIRSIRNKVMHNKNISFDDYSVNLKLLNKINKEIKKVIDVLETQDLLKNKPFKDVINSFNQILIKNNNFYNQLLDINNKILDHYKMLQTTYQDIALSFNPMLKMIGNFYKQEGMIKVFNNIGYYQTLMLNTSIGSNRFNFPTNNLY